MWNLIIVKPFKKTLNMAAKLNIFSEITIKKRNDMIIDYKKTMLYGGIGGICQ